MDIKNKENELKVTKVDRRRNLRRKYKEKGK